MPGIVGCLKSSGTKKEIQIARKALKYSSSYKDETVFEDDSIFCTRTHLNIIGEEKSPFESSGIYCWIEGEFYNIESVRNVFRLSENSEATILVEAYKKNILKPILRKVNGFFVAVLYDSNKSEISFITDRFGLKPLYLWKTGSQLAWCSEVKGFLSFQQFNPEINQEGFNCFIKFGHFLGKNTWFKKVFHLDASTISTYSLSKNKLIYTSQYWSWNAIQPIEIPYKEAFKNIGELFIQAVKKRCYPQHSSFNLGLSGGLDSRAILAAIQNETKLETFTFGKKGCDDVKLARKVAKIHGSENTFFKLTKSNWFNNRVEGIWRSEAAFSFIHLHGAQFHSQIAALGNIGFNGFAGDLVLGGSWVNKPDIRIDNIQAEKKFPGFSHHTNPSSSFYNIVKTDPYFINTHVRKFTAAGLNEIKKFEHRIPFFDNELIEFIYSLPDSYRFKNKIYNDMLLYYFNAYFKKIPWQASGYPISNFLKWYYFPKRLLQVKLKSFGIPSSGFAEYKIWMKNLLHIFEKKLTAKDAIYREYTDYKSIPALNEFKKKGGNFVEIARHVTAEIWFQQIFNNRYFTTNEFLASAQ